MSIDTDRFPKNYEDFRPELWESEGEWRKYMFCLYTGRNPELGHTEQGGME